MKNILRKLSLKKTRSDLKDLKWYIVVYNNYNSMSHERLDEDELKSRLLRGADNIRYIFKYEDQLDIVTEFEDIETGEKNVG